MNLNDRKKKILEAIIEHYIQTAEPVGSRTISKLGNLEVSPATIRNEMSDLEEMGLLVQPHTSAGRVPSTLGYRTYVDRLMKRYELTTNEISKLHSLMKLRINEMDTLIQEITQIYSHLTNYAIIGASPGDNNGFIKNFHFVPLDNRNALLIVVNNKNIVKNIKIDFDTEVSEDELLYISNFLNDKLAGVTKNEINLDKIGELQHGMERYSSILFPVLKFVNECIKSLDNSDVFISGATNLLNYPEYQDVERARDLLNFLDDRDNLQKAVSLADNQNVKLIIGNENEAIELQNCSIVLSSYTLDGEKYGTIGLIGPTRMNYSKAVSNLQFLTKQLDSLLNKTDSEDKT